MIKILLFAFVTVLSASATLAATVPKLGKDCPNGYYRDQTGNYCVSFSGVKLKKLIQKIGKHCPSGFAPDRDSGYCVKY